MKVKVLKAKSKKDANRVAIHLLKPLPIELERAIGRAYAKGFEVVVVHTQKTWPFKDVPQTFNHAMVGIGNKE